MPFRPILRTPFKESGMILLLRKSVRSLNRTARRTFRSLAVCPDFRGGYPVSPGPETRSWSFSRPACVRLLVAAEKPAPGSDPCATLATHEQEVGTACRCIPTPTGRRDHLHHQLAGALIGIVGIAVAPDMGTALGAHFDDVLAKRTAGEGKGISSAKHILPSI